MALETMPFAFSMGKKNKHQNSKKVGYYVQVKCVLNFISVKLGIVSVKYLHFILKPFVEN